MFISDSINCTKPRVALLLIALCICEGRQTSKINLQLGEACGNKFPGRCALSHQCTTLQDYLVEGLLTMKSVEHCSFTITDEIVCCPSDPPKPKAALSYIHLAALTYFNENFDGYEQRCTAVLVTPQLLIASAKCVGQAFRQRPQQAVLGVSDLSEEYQADQVVKISKAMDQVNGIALMKLETPLELYNMARAVDVAEICAEDDVLQGDLRATGWAQSKGKSCSLFEQPMTVVPEAFCSVMSPTVLNKGSKYLCLSPMRPYTTCCKSGSCTRCHIAAGSVLHLHRPDGSRCVAGIATPTSSVDCVDSAAPLYFTILRSPDHVTFLQAILQPTIN